MSLPKKFKLQCFSKIIEKHQLKSKTSHYVLYKIKKHSLSSRLGVSVGKKYVKLAVHRNRIKRLIHNSFIRKLPNEYDYVFIAKSSYLKLSTLNYDDIW